MAADGPLTSRRVRALSALVVALLALLLVNPTPVALGPDPATADAPRRGPADVKLVSPDTDSPGRLWPFTSRRRSFDSLTLPINLVFRERARRVRAQLTHDGDTGFDSVKREWQGVSAEGDLPANDGVEPTWDDTTGATRYTYVDLPGGRGRWLDETAQFHDGTYFGSRYHVRLYEFTPQRRSTSSASADAAWTAVQAHHEYWDWFRLRHTVTSLSKARKHLEGRYLRGRYTAVVSREWYGNGGIVDADGWVTVVDLRPPSVLWLSVRWGWLVVGLVAADRGLFARVSGPARRLVGTRAAPRALALTAVFALLPSAVRAGAIAVELGAPWLHVKAVTAAFYFCLVCGLPAAAVALPKGAHTADWFSLAAITLGVGYLLDFSAIGVTVLPVAVVLHRLLSLVALGLIAAGGARRAAGHPRNQYLVVGLASWIAVLSWPLFGL